MRATAPSLGVVREVEASWADLERAFDQATRAAVGLSGAPSRIWVSEYLDRSERRHDAPDLELATTTDLAPTEAAGGEEPARRPQAAAARPRDRIGARSWRAFGAVLVAAATVGLALLLGADRRSASRS